MRCESRVAIVSLHLNTVLVQANESAKQYLQYEVTKFESSCYEFVIHDRSQSSYVFVIVIQYSLCCPALSPTL